MTDQSQTKDAFFLKEKDGKFGKYFFGNVDGFAVSITFTKDGKAKISSGEQFFIAGEKTNDYGPYYSFIFNKRWWFGNKGEAKFGPYFKLRAGKEAEVKPDDVELNAPAKPYEKVAWNGGATNGQGGGRGNSGGSYKETNSDSDADAPKAGGSYNRNGGPPSANGVRVTITPSEPVKARDPLPTPNRYAKKQ